ADRRFSERPISLRDLVAEKAGAYPSDLFHKPTSDGLQKASTALESLIGDVPNCTLAGLLENCLQKAGILEWILQQPDKHWQLEIVSALFDFIKDEARKDSDLDLKKLVNIFRLMRLEGIRLPLVQFLGTETGINLLTSHGSKGLEYTYVFLAGCNAGNWEKKRKPAGGYSFPDTLFQTLPVHHEEEELRRLFYVAVTRAKQQLYLSYSRSRADGAEWETSLFLEEIRSAHPLPFEKIQLDTPVLAEFSLIQLQTQRPPEIAGAEEAFITPLLEKFVMNVTALNNYLKCPLQFYYQNLVRVPSGKSEATEFGSAVHFALQQLFEKMQADHIFPDITFFIRQFEWYMHRHRENFTAEQFKRRMEYGQTILTAYYQQYVDQWNKIVAVEKNIRNVVVQGIPLKGKLDKLEFDGLSVNVVDYKTGDPEKAKTKLKPPDEKQPNGGDYWRQAVFYKILVDHFPLKNWKVVSTEFDFIEPDKKQQYRKEKIVITPQDITTVTEQIKTVWQKIQARDFYTGCGEADCQWCEFVKNAGLSKSL
ncbi:MAG TPA: PD-(D/E)XK nuclease family protein, partial [Sediminibacterium sp.]|nr:PD-(D/E)XK nuclease family protein [Sediminibacterium sp.]